MSELLIEISRSLKLDLAYLRNLIDNSDHYYKVYFIKKPNGGQRRISHPSPEIKTLQYWCSKEIFSLCKISDAAYAYQKNRSIKMNRKLQLQVEHLGSSVGGVQAA
jgi:hypothetical protein